MIHYYLTISYNVPRFFLYNCYHYSKSRLIYNQKILFIFLGVNFECSKHLTEYVFFLIKILDYFWIFLLYLKKFIGFWNFRKRTSSIFRTGPVLYPRLKKLKKNNLYSYCLCCCAFIKIELPICKGAIKQHAPNVKKNTLDRS